MKRFILAATTALCTGVMFSMTPAHAQSTTPRQDDCFERDESGACIDDPHVPKTGQYQDLNSQYDENGPSPHYSAPSNAAATQHHGNVRITDDTFIYAHNICRWVHNKSTDGRALFIGLGTGDGYQDHNNDALGREQWLSFINSGEGGPLKNDVELKKCCKPFTVSICGKTFNVGFQSIGDQSITIKAGYSKQTTYTCQAGAGGVQPTWDTSWKAVSSGSCLPPPPPPPTGGGSGGGGGKNGGATSHDTTGDGRTDSPGPGGPGQVTKDGPVESPRSGGGGQGGGGGRVICSQLYRRGLMSRDMWAADFTWTMENLSPITVRGYHVWAIPYVELMRKQDTKLGRLAEAFIKPLALWRAEEIAAKVGVEGAKSNWKGKLVRWIGEPACFAIGLFVPEQNWQRLYDAKHYPMPA